MAGRPALLLLLLPLLASLAAGAAIGGSAEAAEALGWRAEPAEAAAGGVGVPASPGPNRALRRRGSWPGGAGPGLPPRSLRPAGCPAGCPPVSLSGFSRRCGDCRFRRGGLPPSSAGFPLWRRGVRGEQVSSGRADICGAARSRAL